jgi:hypothetical protein
MQPVRRILVAVKNPQGKTSLADIKAAQLAQALGAGVEWCPKPHRSSIVR